MESTAADVKARLAAEVHRHRDLLVDVSRRIHAHPETNYEEHVAHDLLTSVLADAGLEVTRAARGVDTELTGHMFRAPEFRGPLDEGLLELVVLKNKAFHGYELVKTPLDVVGWDGTLYPFASWRKIESSEVPIPIAKKVRNCNTISSGSPGTRSSPR